MSVFLSKTMAALINQALSLDPETRSELETLSGHTLLLSLTDWQLDLSFKITEAGIEAHDLEGEQADASIKGPFIGAIQTALAENKNSSMRKTGLRIEGDLGLAKQLQEILSRLNLDWEAPLSRAVGPTIAGGIGEAVSRFRRLSSDCCSSLTRQIGTFLKIESNLLASEIEVSHYNQSVTLLRHDADRLEARIKALIARQEDEQ